jgi:hypothetical protein
VLRILKEIIIQFERLEQVFGCQAKVLDCDLSISLLVLQQGDVFPLGIVDQGCTIRNVQLIYRLF